MTDQPSSSAGNIRKKPAEKRPTKTSKKDDSFTSTAASISLSKMMGGGNINFQIPFLLMFFQEQVWKDN